MSQVSGNALNRNLIKNGCGQDKFRHWTIIDEWSVEKSPISCDEFPHDRNKEMKTHNFCFVTSFELGVKEQIINLQAEGASAELMDRGQPKITVSDWYAGRFDCLSAYRLEVVLLDKYQNVVDDWDFENTVGQGSPKGPKWHKVSHSFRDYGPDVRFIKFVHSGSDRRFWKGHYGSKMTGASVRLTQTSQPAPLNPTGTSDRIEVFQWIDAFCEFETNLYSSWSVLAAFSRAPINPVTFDSPPFITVGFEQPLMLSPPAKFDPPLTHPGQSPISPPNPPDLAQIHNVPDSGPCWQKAYRLGVLNSESRSRERNRSRCCCWKCWCQ